jgi:uncharacterized protein YbjT (DUF2867 family)
MRVLVLGGTGTVGSQVVQYLLDKDVEVSVLTREAAKAATLPRGVEPLIGDLREPETARSIFKGIESVFLLNANGPSEFHEGLMAVSGARLAGVKRLVYLSAMGIEKAPYVPHFAAKLGVEAAVKGSGIEYTILRPNNFYQNDQMFREPLLNFGVYPMPLGRAGISRVDTRDVADAAAIALTGGKGAGQIYNIVGPEALTGESTASAWGKVLDKPIVYVGDDLDGWERQVTGRLPAWAVYYYKLMFEQLQRAGLRATGEDLERQFALLGQESRTFDDFARETAAEWTQGSKIAV